MPRNELDEIDLLHSNKQSIAVLTNYELEISWEVFFDSLYY